MTLSITRLAITKQIRVGTFLCGDIIGAKLNTQTTLAKSEKVESVCLLAGRNYVNCISRNFCQQPTLRHVFQQIRGSTLLTSPSNKYFLNVNSACASNILLKFYSTDTSSENQTTNLSRKEKLKKAVKEYGATVIVFHVAISLLSLGGCYLAVISGLNLNATPFASLGGSSEVAADVGLFVVAYAVHKAFAPVRISITLAATPFIVRYLRKINVLKPPKL